MNRYLQRLAGGLCGADQRLRRRIRANARREDGGFVLLESIMTISLIMVVMAALASLFITGVASTNTHRARQLATQVATSEVETIRGVEHPSQLIAGRDATSVPVQFGAASAVVVPWINQMTPAIDDSATTNEGKLLTTTIPTIGVDQIVNGLTYTVNNYLGWCVITGAGNCEKTGSGLTYLRAVVAVTWPDTHCTGGTCTYVTGTLLSATGDPAFSLNQSPPAEPIVDPPGDQTSMVGDVVTLQLSVEPGTGVPLFTWLTTAGDLPAGLTMSPEGLITGTPTTPVANLSVTVQVTDAFTRVAPATFAWTIVPKLTIAPGDQVATLNKTDTLTLVTTGGSGTGYTYTATGLPAGLSVSGSTITGTPTALGARTVSLTVKDSVNRTTTITFQWTVVALPTVLSPGAQNTTVGAVVNLPLTSACPNTPCTFTMTGAPATLTINSSGAIVGTVTGATGAYTVNVTITDAAGATGTTGNFTLTVKAKPTITTPASQSTTVGAIVSLPITSTCPNLGCTFTMSGAPSGLSVNPITGTISGTVTGTPQTYGAVVVTITDAAGVAVSTSAFSWIVKAGPTVTAPPNQATAIGSAVSLTVTFTCPSSPCTFGISGAPSGLTINSSGVISGTVSGPPQTYPNVRVTITDAAGVSVQSAAFTWTISYPPLVGTTPANQTSTLTTTITALQLTASGGSGSYTWSGGGSLPAGLTMTALGRITGTPTALGTSTVNLTLTDTVTLGTMPISFTWQVVAKPTVTAPPNQTTSVGASINLLNLQLATTCANSPCSYVLNNGPATLSISATGLFSGTITSAAQVFNATVTVTDAAGATATSAVFTWTVKAKPTITTPANQRTTVGVVINLPITSTCANTLCTFTMTGAPAGLSINPSTGVISGTAGGTPQIYSNVVVTITDAASVSVSTNAFTWTVLAKPTITPTNQATTLGATVGVTFPSTCANSPCTITMTGAPTGLSINSSSGLVSGTVGGSPQTYSNVIVTIKDAANVSVASSPFTWTVNPTLTLAYPGNQTARGGVLDTLNLATLVAGGTTPFTYSATGLPAWVTTFNPSTGVMSGTPPTARSITSGITVSVLDSAGVSRTSAAFTWVVTYPSIAIANQVTARNKAVSINLDNYTTGGTAPYTYAITNKPSWLTYTAATHVLSGTTPGSTDTYSGITVTATDAAGTVVTSAAFSWQIVTTAAPVWSVIPEQTTVPNVAATPLDPRPLVTNDASPYAVTGLPPGLTFSATTGVISGTPTLPGDYSVTVTATNSGLAYPSVPFLWHVTDLRWNTITAQTSTRNIADSLDPTTFDSGGISPLTYSATGLPTGMNINASTGFINGTPSVANAFSVKVTVTDLSGASATSLAFNWVVS